MVRIVFGVVYTVCTLFYSLMNVLAFIAESVQCIWTQRDPLPHAWIDHQPFNCDFSSHPGMFGDTCMHEICSNVHLVFMLVLCLLK